MATPSPAKRAYTIRISVSMAAYVVAIFGVVWVINHHPPSGWPRYVLAVLPALPIAGVIWALGRYLQEEADEYLRAVQARIVLRATGVTLVLTTAWGFLETFADGPNVPMYAVLIVFCAALGALQCWTSLIRA
jgi:glucose uptake protein GlcU